MSKQLDNYYKNRERILTEKRAKFAAMNEEQKEQVRAYNRAARAKNIAKYKKYDKDRTTPKRREVSKLRNREHPNAYKLWAGAKKRAKDKGIAFNLDLKDIVIPAACPILGIQLIRGVSCAHAASPSIDRLIPAIGYVKGNVWVISHRANSLKNNATSDELFKVAQAVRLIEAHTTKDAP